MTISGDNSFDYLIIGAGIAGVSLAAEIAPFASVMIIETEDVPAFHSTGRSAAFWHESYGGPKVRPLTAASAPLLLQPDPEFCEHSLMKQRGAINLAHRDNGAGMAAWQANFAGSGMAMQNLDRVQLEEYIPGLLPDWTFGVLEPDCCDIDVMALHAAYARVAKRAGAALQCKTEFLSARKVASAWTIDTSTGTINAANIINAAGAWADIVAQRAGVQPVGIQPYKRTIMQLRVDKPVPAHMPLVLDIAGSFYVKGESEGRVWLSPHDEITEPAGDSWPEDMDIAIAIDSMEKALDWRVQNVERSWAGQRSFAPDRLPVYGRDPAEAAFYWCAGQGGYGIQTAPAAAKMAAADLLGHAPDPILAGVEAALYRPDRFH
jgi:D-arginine dehydrogenase